VVYGSNLAGDDLSLPAARIFKRLGYTHVTVLAGGLQAWKDGGGELFRDVNVPSKSFGELVESVRHTPSLSRKKLRH
jgi:3-mercaptopyruvate sulfurtransferase SseA